MSNHQKCFFKNRAFRSAEVNLIYQMESRARGKERKQNVYSEWKEGNDISLARLLWWNAAGCMALTADVCFSHFGWMGSRDQGLLQPLPGVCPHRPVFLLAQERALWFIFWIQGPWTPPPPPGSHPHGFLWDPSPPKSQTPSRRDKSSSIWRRGPQILSP